MEVRRDKASIYARAMSTAVFRLAPTTEKKKKKKGRTPIAGLMPIQLALTMTWWRHMSLR